MRRGSERPLVLAAASPLFPESACAPFPPVLPRRVDSACGGATHVFCDGIKVCIAICHSALILMMVVPRGLPPRTG